jgi:hypothetical protein
LPTFCCRPLSQLLPVFIASLLAGFCQRIQIVYLPAKALLPFTILELPILFAGLCQPFNVGLCPHLLTFLLAAFMSDLCLFCRPLPLYTGGFCWTRQLKIVPAFANLSAQLFSAFTGIFPKTFADLCRPEMPLLMYGRHLPAFVTIEFDGLSKTTIANLCRGFAAAFVKFQ